MKLRFLGTGTSFGVPVVGCDCAVCTSADPRDRRTRHGALLDVDGQRLLVDTPPELRQQLISACVDRIDAVWFTHDHADHTHGIDDLRVFSARLRAQVRAYADPVTAMSLARKFAYIFDPECRPPEGTTKPEIELIPFAPDARIAFAKDVLVPVAVPHGPGLAWGFRYDRLGYITDAKQLTADARAALNGVEVLVLNALWFGSPHPTHFNVEEAVEAARSIGAARTYLTHITHRVAHAELERRLPDGVMAAWDGLTIEI